MKLLGSTKINITKGENGENVPHLDITEVVSVHCIIVNNDYQHNRIVYCIVYICFWFGDTLAPQIVVQLKSKRLAYICSQ